MKKTSVKDYEVVKQERTIITVKNLDRGMVSIDCHGLQFIHLANEEKVQMVLCETTFGDGDIRHYLDIRFNNGVSISLADIVSIEFTRCEVKTIPLL